MYVRTETMYCVDKPTLHVARRLYGGQTPWISDEQVVEDEITRQRYCVEYFSWGRHFQNKIICGDLRR